MLKVIISLYINKQFYNKLKNYLHCIDVSNILFLYNLYCKEFKSIKKFFNF